MANQADASITIGADLTPLQAAFSEAQTLVKGKMDGIAGTAISSLKGVAAAFAAAFAFKEVKDLVGSVAEARAALKDLSEVTGTSVENLSRIQGVAKLSGKSMDDVGAAMVKLTKNLAGGDDEATAASDALESLGINARNSDGSLKDSGDLYLEIAKKLGEYGDGAGKTAFLLAVFGKEGAKQAPLLKDIAETGDLVVKTTASQAYEADEYTKNLKRLETALGANKKIIAGELIPVADDFVKSLLELMTSTDGVTKELKTLAADGSLREWGRDGALVAASVVDAFAKVVQTFAAVGTGIGGIAAATAAAARGEMGEAASIVKDMNEKLKNAFSGPTLEERLRKQFAVSDEKRSGAIDYGFSEGWDDQLKYTGKKGKGKGGGRLEDTSKAEYAVAKAQLDAAANLQKEYLKETEEAYDADYAHNLIGIREYYERRTGFEEAGLIAEMNAKRQEIEANKTAQGSAATDRERLTLKAQEIVLTGQLTVLTAQFGNVAVKNSRAMTDAEKLRAAAMREVEIASKVNVGNAQVAMDRIALDTRRQLRQTSEADAIQQERGFEDRITAIQRDALEQRLAMEKAGMNDPVRIASLNAQIEQLERDHQQRLTQLDAEATVERSKYQTEAANAIEGNFATFFNDLTDRTKKLSDVFKDLGKSILASLNQAVSKKLANDLVGAGTTGGGILDGIIGKILPSGSSPSAKTGTTAPGDDAAKALQDLSGCAGIAGDAMSKLSTDGIGGMFKSSIQWVAQNVLGIASTETQVTASTTLSGGLLQLTTAAYGAAAALSSVAGGSAASSGSSAFAGLGGAAAGADTGSFASWFAEAGGAFLDTGTDFVPKDMLAMIHKGERIVPASQNNGNASNRGPTVVNISVPGGTNRDTANQVARRVAVALNVAAERNG